MKKFLITILILLIIGFGAYKFIMSNYQSSLQAVDKNDKTPISIVIPSGSNTTKIANLLKENNLIKNVNAFKRYAKNNSYDSLLRAGTFTLSKNMTVKEILDIISKNGIADNTINLKLIEGLTKEQAAEQIAKQLSLDKDKLLDLMNNAVTFRDKFDFLKENEDVEDLQGYLLPNTYNLYKGMDEEQVIEFLLGQFDKYYKSDIVPKLKDNKLKFTQIINLASIIEKEALIEKERPIIAGVFLNRLDIKMKLQSCATVNYARGEWKAQLSEKDIKIDSPYNTYIHEGLPPTPINSPGISSINAALSPAKVDYLYFLAKGDGSHYFSKTYEEHLAAKSKYLGK